MLFKVTSQGPFAMLVDQRNNVVDQILSFPRIYSVLRKDRCLGPTCAYSAVQKMFPAFAQTPRFTITLHLEKLALIPKFIYKTFRQ